MDFKVILKHGTDRQALALIVAYDKRFPGHRFLWSTGHKVTRRGFDPARPGKALKALLKVAEEAYKSLSDSGLPISQHTLKARIELIRDRYAFNGEEVSIWTGSKVEAYTIPQGVSKDAISKVISDELVKQRPNFEKAIKTLLAGSEGDLFQFWQDVIDGKIKPRSGKDLKRMTVITKRKSKNVLLAYQAQTGQPVTFEVMNRDFYNRFTLWMSEVRGYDPNTIGAHVKELKSILNLARANERFDNDSFTYWPVTREKNEVVTLTKEELLKINSLELSGTLGDVRDIFVLACFLGPRISDYKSFRCDSLSTRAGITYFEYVQEKTGRRVQIPVHPIAQDILAKRGGEFPRMISEQNFRYALKEISQAAGLDDRVTIKIRNGRPVYARKWEAISPHSARRTFASNLFYGWFGKPMPASLAMRYTGHKSEKSFMLYIGATEAQLNEMALQYFDPTPQLKAV